MAFLDTYTRASIDTNLSAYVFGVYIRPMNNGNVISLAAAREAKEERAADEIQLLIDAGLITPEDGEGKPAGMVHIHSLEDGSTRITLTVPPGQHPVDFLADVYKNLEHPFKLD